MRILDTHGASIPDARRLASIALLAKTANQLPGRLPRLQAALDHGGTYEDLLDAARNIADNHRAYDGLKAVTVAERYQSAFGSPQQPWPLSARSSKYLRQGSIRPPSPLIRTLERRWRRSVRGRNPLRPKHKRIRFRSARTGIEQYTDVDVVRAVAVPLEQSGPISYKHPRCVNSR